MRKIIVILTALFALTALAGSSPERRVQKDNKHGIDERLNNIYTKAMQRACTSDTTKTALLLADSMFTLAKKMGDQKAQCMALEVPIIYYFYRFDNNKGPMRQAVERQRQFAEGTPYKDFIFNGWAQYIITIQHHHNYDDVMMELEEFQEEALRLRNTNAIARSYNLYARFYSLMKLNHTAVEYNKRAVKYALDKGDAGIVSSFYIAIAKNYYDLNMNDSAIHFSNLALKEKNLDLEVSNSALWVKGMAYMKTKQYDKMRQMVETLKKNNDTQHTRYSDLHYHSLNLRYLTYVKNDYEGALREADLMLAQPNIIQGKFEIYQHFGHYKEAYEYKKLIDQQHAISDIEKIITIMTRQDSLLEASIAEQERQSLELVNTRMLLEQTKLKEQSALLRLKNTEAEKEEHEEQIRAQRLNLNHTQLKISEDSARVMMEQSKYENALAKAENERMKLSRNNTILVCLMIALLIITIAGMVYIRYRNTYARVLKEEHQMVMEASYLKDDLIRNMREEMRTPLKRIVSSSNSIAAIDGYQPTQEEIAELLAIITENTQLFTSSIDDMIEASQHEEQRIMGGVKS